MPAALATVLCLSSAVMAQTTAPSSSSGGGSSSSSSGGTSTPSSSGGSSSGGTTGTLYFEEGNLVRSGETVQALGPDLMGDQVNEYNGALTFEHTDVSLPGNSALPVAAGRNLVTGSKEAAAVEGLFGDWDLNIPHLHTLAGSQPGDTWYGTNLNTGLPNTNRCTQFYKPPLAVGSQNAQNLLFDPYIWWAGYHMSIPGAGDQTVLGRSSVNHNQPLSGSYPVVTKGQWQLSCLSSLQYGAGEGFLALSPDGTTYRFDHLVSRGYFAFHPPGNQTQPTIGRTEVWILPTTITDRFGNTVTYSYDTTDPWKLNSIIASDGRKITFTYWSGTHHVYQVNDQTRTWTYNYDGGGHLQSVVLPDSSNWTFNLSALEHNPSFSTDPLCDGTFNLIDQATYTGTITHPSGAIGTFSHTMTWHGMSYVPGNQLNCEVPGANQIPVYSATYSLTSKQLSGPGMSNMTWSYLYNVNIQTPLGTQQFGSFSAAPGSVVTTIVQVTDPENNVVQNTYGTHYGVDDGLLKSSVVYPASVPPLSLPSLRTTVRTYNDSNAGPYPSVVGGYNSGGDEMSTIYTPQLQQTITQQGETFSSTIDTQLPPINGNNICSTRCFDAYARPLGVTKSSSLGYSKDEETAYYDDTTHWILGQIASVTVNPYSNNPPVISNMTFTASTATPASVPYQRSTYGKLVNTYGFYADGTLNTIKDGRSNTTSYSNYKRGLAQNISFADGSTASALVNNIGTIASVTRQSALPTQTSPATYYTWSYDYDAMGRIWHEYPPTGDAVSYNPKVFSFVQVGSAEYGIAANHWRQTITRGNAVTINYFDARWRKLLTATYDSANVSGTEKMQLFEYDEYNRNTYASYPARSISSINTSPPPFGTCAEQSGQPAGTYTCYDALGRTTKAISDSELSNPITINISYLNYFTKQVQNPRLYNTTTTFQAFDEPAESAPVTIAEAQGQQNVEVDVSIVRDVFDKPLSITRSGTLAGTAYSATRSYVYDGNQRLCKSIDPEIGATVQTLDAADNVQWKAIGLNLLDGNCDTASVPVNKQIVYSYDTRNRLTGVGYGDGSPSIGRAYWADGALGAVVSNGSTWTYGYNNYRSLATEQIVYGTVTGTATHSYDANAHESQLQYPDLSVVTYAPDALGEPTQVSGQTPTQQITNYTQSGTTVTYQPNGAIAGFTFGNGVIHARSQNTRLLPSLNQDYYQSTSILKDQYSYDENGNIAGIKDQVSGLTTRTMTYDALDRMTGVAATNEWVNASYTYNPLDDMTTYTVGGRTVNYTFSPGQTQLSKISIVSGGTTTPFAISLDSQGNVTTIGTQGYTFDQGNRLTSVSGGESYAYDGLGRRTSAVSNGTTKLYFYSLAGQLLYSRSQTGSNVATTDYIYLGGDEIAENNSASGIRYVHSDVLGSPVAHTNISAQVLDQTRYEPYGATWSGTVPTGIGFTGHVNDSDTGFVYMQQRYYSPIAARFLSMDPVTTDANTGDSFARYEYAGSNPYLYTDPDGESLWSDNACKNNPFCITIDFTGGASNGTKDKPKNISGVQAATSQSAIAAGAGAGAIDILEEIKVTATRLLPDMLPELTVVGRGLALGAIGGLAFVINAGLVTPLGANDTTMDAEEHTSGARPSTKPKHEKGTARKLRDKRGEKGDDRRDPRGKRPDGHKGPWPGPKINDDSNAGEKSSD